MKHILFDMGERPLTVITRKDLQALLDAKAGSGLSASVVGHIRWQLLAIFGMAKSDGLTVAGVNPAEELVTGLTLAEAILPERDRALAEPPSSHGFSYFRITLAGATGTPAVPTSTGPFPRCKSGWFAGA